MTSLLALTLPIANPTWIFFVVLLIILLALPIVLRSGLTRSPFVT